MIPRVALSVAVIAGSVSAAWSAQADVGQSECPRPTAQRILTFDDRAIQAVVADIAAKTRKQIAIAPELEVTRLSFSMPEAATSEELFQNFVAALRSLGYRTIETGAVATVLPVEMVVPTVAEHQMKVSFEQADIRMIAEVLGKETGRIIAVAWPLGRTRIEKFQAGPATPEEVYQEFIREAERLGYKAVVAGRIVTLVRADAPQ